MTDTETTQELYACESCTCKIPTHLARVSCHSCPNHHLCANCHVIQNFVPPHTKSHSAMVFKESGVVVPLPPGFSKRPAPALPPRPKSYFEENPDNASNRKGNEKEKSKEPELGAANWEVLWSIMKAPLEKKGKKPQSRSVNVEGTNEAFEVNDVTGHGLPGKGNHDEAMVSGGLGIPPSPTKSVRRGIERVDSTAATMPSNPQPEKWEALFDSDSTPTPIFVALMSIIFSHLDTEHTGFLSPETYSGFLETQGCKDNIWKRAFESAEGEHGKEVADLELSVYFTELNFEHMLKLRIRDPTDSSDEEPKSAVGHKIRNSLRFNANMPMISRQGFIDVCRKEYLKDPNKGHEYLGRVVKEYGIWKELGDIPRDVLPQSSNSKLTEKVTRVEELESSGAKSGVLVDELNDGESKETYIARLSDSIKVSKPESSQKNHDPDSLSSESQIDVSSTYGPAPIEEQQLVSPIALGAPAMAFNLKGGESKIDAMKRGEQFEPTQETQQPGEKNEVGVERIAPAETLENEKKDMVAVEKSKISESGTKTPSLEDLYSAN